LHKRYIDEQMSGSFFGIGAQLTYDDGNIKIASLVTGNTCLEVGRNSSGRHYNESGAGQW
jgi:carboxyl-terminal processing protease